MIPMVATKYACGICRRTYGVQEEAAECERRGVSIRSKIPIKEGDLVMEHGQWLYRVKRIFVAEHLQQYELERLVTIEWGHSSYKDEGEIEKQLLGA